jgi:Xaa-Pro dipeptidase
MLHLPDPTKRIERGNAVHWDICLRYEGYPIDTSRTRVVGKATDLQRRAYEASLRMYDAVIGAARPGVRACDLLETAEKVAREDGFELWDHFLGHGIGMDTRERPDMTEQTRLEANMVLAIEPRVAIGEMYLLGNEDMTLITEDGAVPLNEFPKVPLELEN